MPDGGPIEDLPCRELEAAGTEDELDAANSGRFDGTPADQRERLSLRNHIASLVQSRATTFAVPLHGGPTTIDPTCN